MDLRMPKNHDERRKLIEDNRKINLDSIGSVFIDNPESVHCENLLGGISIPVGIAGPVRINGEHINGDYYIPLATTEGALIASVNRGCKAISESGGATVHIETVGTTRGPVFSVSGIKQAVEFKAWLEEHTSELAQIAASTSSHIKLLKIEVQIMGRNVYVRFSYDTSDAMGMNMVTIATQAITEYIKEKKDIECLAVAGNYDIDKKPSWLNSISGRGKKGWAEVVIPAAVMSSILKTDAKEFCNLVIQKCWGGSMLAGSLGFNAHFANIAAAFYAATGQDIAHVVEASQGVTSAEILENGDTHFSIYMPDIMIGTVGGGTKLKTQTEARSIIGVSKSTELAEVFVAAVLAGELSLLASIAQKTLANAHQKLGR
jgi:hydroxymethylglutaryl-CoA reductase (NADPH)